MLKKDKDNEDKDNAHFDLRNIVKKVMLCCGRQGRARDTDARAHTHAHKRILTDAATTERQKDGPVTARSLSQALSPALLGTPKHARAHVGNARAHVGNARAQALALSRTMSASDTEFVCVAPSLAPTYTHIHTHTHTHTRTHTHGDANSFRSNTLSHVTRRRPQSQNAKRIRVRRER